MPDGIRTIIKRNGEVVPFDRDKITVAIYKAAAAIGGHDRDLSERLSGQVVEALEATYTEDASPTVEEIQDVVERVLIKNGHARTAKSYILYRSGRARMRAQRSSEEVEYLPYKQMWQALDWAVEQGCHTVEGLNEIILSGRLGELIEASDERFESMIDGAAAAILERHEELRFIVVAGPSSSGKTTTTHKLMHRLEAEGVHVIPLALDNYFFDLELHPRDEFGDYDFETPEALDLKLINQHLEELDRGRAIDVPVYDFKSGKRTSETTRFEASAETLILLDTLHGLYGGLTESVPDEHKFRVYIETIAQLKNTNGRYIRWTDIRLLRRMIRDSKFRAYSPERTILHWHFVRRSELKHIIPHQSQADYQVNSSLAYELPFLERHLAEHLEPFLEKWQDNEKRLDGYLRARRISELMNSIADVSAGDEAKVPATSLLREFIGGGAYDIH